MQTQLIQPVESAPWLQHTGGNGDMPERTVLDTLPLVIGRVESVDLQVNSTRVSREHAVIERHGSGFRIRDLGSTNGTFVNGQRVKESALTDGDVVLIADCEFAFCCGSQAGGERNCPTQVMANSAPDNPHRRDDQVLSVRRLQQILLDGGFGRSAESILDLHSAETIGHWWSATRDERSHGEAQAVALPESSSGASCHLALRYWQVQRIRATQSWIEAGHDGQFVVELAGEEIDLPWETISHLEWLRQQVGPNQLVVGLPLSAVRDGRRTEELGRWIEQTETSLAYTGFVGGRTQVLQLADRPPQLLAIAPSLAASLRSRSVQCRQLSAVAQACTEIGCQALITGARCQDDVDACQELGLHLVVWPAPQGSLTGR